MTTTKTPRTKSATKTKKKSASTLRDLAMRAMDPQAIIDRLLASQAITVHEGKLLRQATVRDFLGNIGVRLLNGPLPTLPPGLVDMLTDIGMASLGVPRALPEEGDPCEATGRDAEFPPALQFSVTVDETQGRHAAVELCLEGPGLEHTPPDPILARLAIDHALWLLHHLHHQGITLIFPMTQGPDVDLRIEHGATLDGLLSRYAAQVAQSIATGEAAAAERVRQAAEAAADTAKRD